MLTKHTSVVAIRVICDLPHLFHLNIFDFLKNELTSVLIHLETQLIVFPLALQHEEWQTKRHSSNLKLPANTMREKGFIGSSTCRSDY